MLALAIMAIKSSHRHCLPRASGEDSDLKSKTATDRPSPCPRSLIKTQSRGRIA
jgi:hypothetical protein